MHLGTNIIASIGYFNLTINYHNGRKLNFGRKVHLVFVLMAVRVGSMSLPRMTPALKEMIGDLRNP